MTLKMIKLHIEELVLHSFVPGDRYHIADSVERELSWLLSEQGVQQSLSQGGRIAHLDGGIFDAARGSKHEVMGTQVAKVIYGGLGK